MDLQLSQVIVLCPEPAHPDKQDQSLPLTGNLCSGRKFSAPSLLKSDPWEVLLATPTSLLRSTPFCCLMRKALGNAVFPTWLCFQGCPSSLVQCIRLAHWGDGSQPGGWGGTSVQVGFPWGAPLGALPLCLEEKLSKPLVPGLKSQSWLPSSPLSPPWFPPSTRVS